MSIHPDTSAASTSGPSKSSSCPNKVGRNQYRDRPAPDDPLVSSLLKDYHSNGITDRTQVSKLLLEEHGIVLGESSVSRRKRKLGLKASRLTTLELDINVRRQLVLDQMAKDPEGRLGARKVKQGILHDTGIHLTREYIREEMRNLDPVGHAARGPAHVKAKRQQKQLAGQNSSIQPSESDNFIFVHPPAQMEPVPSHLQSGPIPVHQHRFVSLPPVPHSPAMEVDEDSDSTGFDPPPYPSQPGTPEILPSLHITPEPEEHPDTLSARRSRTVLSPSMTEALDMLRGITPRMSALTQLLNGLDENKEVLDLQAHGLVIAGMQAAALLERRLARVASRAQYSRP